MVLRIPLECRRFALREVPGIRHIVRPPKVPVKVPVVPGQRAPHTIRLNQAWLRPTMSSSNSGVSALFAALIRRGTMPDHAKKIFISYRRSDAAAMSIRIYDAMKAQFGRKRVFRDA